MEEKKHRIDFFKNVTESVYPDYHPIIAPVFSSDDKHVVWQLHHFLTESECAHIIKKFEGVKDYKEFNDRGSKRLLCFDNIGHLEKIIKNRLRRDNFLSKLNDINHVEPYGFDKIEWRENSDGINPCFRISKYHENSNGFNYHRDLQYTKSDNIKSNYTLLIFLNNQTEGGFEILIPQGDHYPVGMTIKEEMEKYKFESIHIKPKRGMAIIFDQRLIHRSKPNTEEKYILRTDLLCDGKFIEAANINNKQLCQKLFRTAQLLEIRGEDPDNLYEITTTMRMFPDHDYLSAFENKYLETQKSETVIENKIGECKRTGTKYVFKINDINIDDLNEENITILSECGRYLISTCCDCLDVNNQVIKSDIVGNVETGYFFEESTKGWKTYGTRKTYKVSEIHDEDFVPEDEMDCRDFEDQCNRHLECVKQLLNIDEGKTSNRIDGLVNVVFDCYQYHGPKCTGCRLCDEDCYSDDVTNFYVYNRVEFNGGEFDFKKIKITKTKITGQMSLMVKSKEFNHASCQCERYYHLGDSNDEEFLNVNFIIDFTITKNKITMDYVPKIVM